MRRKQGKPAKTNGVGFACKVIVGTRFTICEC